MYGASLTCPCTRCPATVRPGVSSSPCISGPKGTTSPVTSGPNSHVDLFEGKGEDLISFDAVTQSSIQNSLELILESLHFIEAESHVGFYELLFNAVRVVTLD
jgi:hypothetical protein